MPEKEPEECYCVFFSLDNVYFLMSYYKNGENCVAEPEKNSPHFSDIVSYIKRTPRIMRKYDPEIPEKIKEGLKKIGKWEQLGIEKIISQNS